MKKTMTKKTMTLITLLAMTVLNWTTCQASNLPFQYELEGVLIERYEDPSIQVRIEEIDGFLVSKIWVRDPGRQFKKVEASADFGIETKTVGDMMRPISDAVIAINGSGFGAETKYGAELEEAPWGNIVITNGDVRWTHPDKTKETCLGIDTSGNLVFLRKATLKSMKKNRIVNTIRFSNQFLIENQVRYDYSHLTSRSYRTAIGQMDSNNYVLLSARKPKLYDEVTDLGVKLGCPLLYNCDGGGSATLWFRGTYLLAGEDPPRKVADALYFTSSYR